MQHQHRVLNATGHGAEFVERPAERHRAGSRNASVGWPQTGNATAHARAYDAASCLAADEKPTSPAAVAAPGPALDPDDPSSSNHGFIVCPPNQMSLSASAPMLSLATSTAPASFRRFTTAASSAGTRSRKGSAPYVVGNTGSIQQVFAAPRNTVKWPSIFSCSYLLVGLFRLRAARDSRVNVITQCSWDRISQAAADKSRSASST